MNLANYLESTYLKTKEENCFSKDKMLDVITNLINEAIQYRFKVVMLRSEYVNYAQQLISNKESDLLIGTVVDFPLGDKTVVEKIKESLFAINNGVSELDFVCDYNAFKRSDFKKFDNDILEASKTVLQHDKTIKWIIETGALSKKQIFDISLRISNIINNNFKSNKSNFYIKTSTGYYNGIGANIEDIKIIKKAAKDICIKASGGISTYEIAMKMIQAGATRIGTSNALNIYKQ
jgi:deoxyribose-phosphate aldolase